MKQVVPAPITLCHLIESNNQLLKMYQSELSKKVTQANDEMMRMLNLDPNDGWRLDVDTYTYIKVEDAPPVGE